MQVDSVRNSDGIWINTSVFREPALHFQKYGYYCADPAGSPAWYEYWKEERKRVIEGYSVAGARITGEHYFYLNYCPIMRVEDVNASKSKKVYDFPDFWDGDYNYFWSRALARDGILDSNLLGPERKEEIYHLDTLEQALELKKIFESLHLEVKIEKDHLKGGYNIIVGKSRRRGYSYKNSSCAVRHFLTEPKSLTILGAYEKKYLYPKGIFTMCLDLINFINNNTAWIMPSDEILRSDHIKASYYEYIDGVQVTRGFKSEIMALTFKDNADAARGKDAVELVFEESGAFGTPGLLKASYRASEDCVKAGTIKTGLITIFGTSGDLEGGTKDYAEMYFNPNKFDLLPFENIWDEGYKASVGFFHPANWNLEGHYDKQGNSDKDSGKKAILKERQKVLDHGGTSVDIQQIMQEKPLSPTEAFSYTTKNLFPTTELKRQRDYLLSENLHIKKGQPVDLYRDPHTGKVLSEPDMRGELNPIRTFDGVIGNPEGAVVIYEYPIPGAPRGAYKIGYDPVMQDDGTSLACVVVYKGIIQGSDTKNIIVAEWIGRKKTNDDNHYVVELLSDLYNSPIMFENMVPDVKNYFKRRKKLHMLALQPDSVIARTVKSSKVNRVYGCHINRDLKNSGEQYIRDWLLESTDYDEDGFEVLNLNRIYSMRFVEELLNYNSKSNDFDMTSAMMMCMFQLQEEYEGTTHSVNKTDKRLERLKQLRFTGNNIIALD